MAREIVLDGVKYREVVEDVKTGVLIDTNNIILERDCDYVILRYKEQAILRIWRDFTLKRFVMSSCYPELKLDEDNRIIEE